MNREDHAEKSRWIRWRGVRDWILVLIRSVSWSNSLLWRLINTLSTYQESYSLPQHSRELILDISMELVLPRRTWKIFQFSLYTVEEFNVLCAHSHVKFQLKSPSTNDFDTLSSPGSVTREISHYTSTGNKANRSLERGEKAVHSSLNSNKIRKN